MWGLWADAVYAFTDKRFYVQFSKRALRESPISCLFLRRNRMCAAFNEGELSTLSAKTSWSLEGKATRTFWELGTFGGLSFLGTDSVDRAIFSYDRLQNPTSQFLYGFCFFIPFAISPAVAPSWSFMRTPTNLAEPGAEDPLLAF